MIDETSLRGWVQKRPGDPCALRRRNIQTKAISTLALRYGDSADDAKESVRKLLEKAKKAGPTPIRTASATFWANHWRWVPHIDIPSETFRFSTITGPISSHR